MSHSKVVRIISKGKDDTNLLYFASLSPYERLAHLEELRQRYNALISKDAATQRLQRIYRVVKQAWESTGRLQDLADVEMLKKINDSKK